MEHSEATLYKKIQDNTLEEFISFQLPFLSCAGGSW